MSTVLSYRLELRVKIKYVCLGICSHWKGDHEEEGRYPVEGIKGYWGIHETTVLSVHPGNIWREGGNQPVVGRELGGSKLEQSKMTCVWKFHTEIHHFV